ncbi:MAG: DUF6431 domain-containing protein [Acidimicrobiales bacterium]
MVGTDEAVVEQDLVAGRLACPCCQEVLCRWGHARTRTFRRAGGKEERFRPRRSKCSGCAVTHVLLMDSCLIRRRDEAAVIGAALEAKAAGSGSRSIADALGVDRGIVRGWLRCFARDAEVIRAHFTRWAHALDADLGAIKAAGNPFCDALEAIGVAVRAAAQRLGPRPPFSVVARLSGGALLCSTSFPLLLPP